jgi:aldose 1-epimerase
MAASSSVSSASASAHLTTVTKSGTDGDSVDVWTLSCSSTGITVVISSIGASIESLQVPDRSGKVDDIVLGFDLASGSESSHYSDNNPYFGCIVGRVANRIACASFDLDGKNYTLAGWHCEMKRNSLFVSYLPIIHFNTPCS